MNKLGRNLPEGIFKVLKITGSHCLQRRETFFFPLNHVMCVALFASLKRVSIRPTSVHSCTVMDFDLLHLFNIFPIQPLMKPRTRSCTLSRTFRDS